jgi:hypothetical protein
MYLLEQLNNSQCLWTSFAFQTTATTCTGLGQDVCDPAADQCCAPNTCTYVGYDFDVCDQVFECCDGLAYLEDCDQSIDRCCAPNTCTLYEGKFICIPTSCVGYNECTPGTPDPCCGDYSCRSFPDSPTGFACLGSWGEGDSSTGFSCFRSWVLSFEV